MVALPAAFVLNDTKAGSIVVLASIDTCCRHGCSSVFSEAPYVYETVLSVLWAVIFLPKSASFGGRNTIKFDCFNEIGEIHLAPVAKVSTATNSSSLHRTRDP